MALRNYQVPTASPTPSFHVFDPSGEWITYRNSRYNYELQYRTAWSEVPHDPNVYTHIYFHAPDDSQLEVLTVETEESTLANYIMDYDKNNTTRERLPNLEVLKVNTSRPNELQRIEYNVTADSSSIVHYLWHEQYVVSIATTIGNGKTYTVVSEVFQYFPRIISSFRFLEPEISNQTCGGITGLPCPPGYNCRIDKNYPDASGVCEPNGAYTCPPGGWIDCMPGPGDGIKWECTEEFQAWAKINCPEYQGVAY